MTLFTLALLLEFFSGESFIQQIEDGSSTIEKYSVITGSLILGSLFFVGNLIVEEL
jgi:hypothetical protein